MSPSSPSGSADARRIFYLLLPAGIWVGTLIPSVLIGSYHEDDRNFAGACILIALAPFALGYGILAIKEGVTKSGGNKALTIAMMWNLTLSAAMTITFLVLARRVMKN